MSKPMTEILRYPIRKNETLQGWDSADELALSHIKSLDLTDKKILVVNDQFGALSVGFEGFNFDSYTDSFVSSMGILQNSDQKVHPLKDLNELKGPYDLVLIQIPKNMSFFEDILATLTHHLHPGSKVICMAMVKHLSSTSFDLLGKYIGATTTSLAQKKARLIFANFEKTPALSPFPIQVHMDGFEKFFTNHSNLFSREKLDIGTRFFLEHIPQGNFEKILDLGCANGIIGIKAKMVNPKATIYFSDESYMAIKSSKANYEAYHSDPGIFHWTNCFENQEKNFLDLVLCNPPFHQQNTIGDFIAWQMFQDSYRSLKKGGSIRVIGNSHLGYHVKLSRLFGNSQIVAKNSKFMICESFKKD